MLRKQNSIAEEMFSVENLRRIATQDLPDLTIEPPPLSTATATASGANGQLVDGKFVIPIEIAAGDMSMEFNVSAKLSIKISVDLDELIAAHRILDKADRLEATRRVIKMSETECQLSFA